MKNNVLVIAYYFPPMGLSGVQRTLKFVKYLPENGWKAHVLTTSDDSYYAYDESLQKELDKIDCEVYRTQGTKLEKKKRFPSYTVQKLGSMVLQTFNQPDSKIKWKKPALELAEKIIKENNISMIFATAPPYTDFLIGNELSKKYDIPLIIDYRDTWVDNPFNFYATPFHKNRAIEMEKEVLTQCDKAIVISRHAKELIIKRYTNMSYNDITIIPHGYDPDDISYIEKDVLKNESKFVMTHSGMFQDDRTPKYVFMAVKQLLESKRINPKNFEIKLLGLMRKSHEKLIYKYGLDEVVKIYGHLDHKEVMEYLGRASILWLWMNDTIRTPGKLYEYFGTRKPVLAMLPDGVIKDLANESKNATTCNPKDVDSIANAIHNYYKAWKNNELKQTNIEFVEKYNRQNLTKQLAIELSHAARI